MSFVFWSTFDFGFVADNTKDLGNDNNRHVCRILFRSSLWKAEHWKGQIFERHNTRMATPTILEKVWHSLYVKSFPDVHVAAMDSLACRVFETPDLGVREGWIPLAYISILFKRQPFALMICREEGSKLTPQSFAASLRRSPKSFRLETAKK